MWRRRFLCRTYGRLRYIKGMDILKNEACYRFLLMYYLEDLWSPPIYDEIMESPNQDEVIKKYIAAWAQWDDKLQAYLKEKFAREQ